MNPEFIFTGKGCLSNFFFPFLWAEYEQSSSNEKKRLSAGACVSGAFADFYANPDPILGDGKRQRIFGVIQEACGPQKYNVLFDSGVIKECISNILCVEAALTSVPINGLQVGDA
jgi:hypothetical protein